MYFVFLGPPGVGKGTQAKRTAAEFGVVHLSTGDLLRDHVKNQTALGRKAQPFMESGRLVPDDLIVRMTIERMKSADCARGVLLDGFPRTMVQADSLDRALTEAALALSAAIFFNASDEVLIERLSGRRHCPKCKAGYHVRTLTPRVEGVCDVCYGALAQRDDDQPDVIANRIRVYREQSLGVIDHYRGRDQLIEIDSQGPVDEIFARVREAIVRLAPECAVRLPADETAATSVAIEEKKTEARIVFPSRVPSATVLPEPAAQRPARPAPAAQRPARPAPAAQRPAKPAPAAQLPAKPGPAAQRSAKPAPAAKLPAKPGPAAQRPAKPAPAAKPAASRPSGSRVGSTSASAAKSRPTRSGKPAAHKAAAKKKAARAPARGAAAGRGARSRGKRR